MPLCETVQRGEKRALDALDLHLEAVVSCRAHGDWRWVGDAGNKALVICKSNKNS